MLQELQVPHLTTANTGPLLTLENLFLEKQIEIEQFFRAQWQQTPAPIYGSVDLRNAGFKVAPVDMNLFPAGFNNLNPDFMALAIQAMQIALEQRSPQCKKVLLIAESHTRNMRYFENIVILSDIIHTAGYEVRVAAMRDISDNGEVLNFDNGRELTIYPVEREGKTIKSGNFVPCVVILNNDLSDGIPDILKNSKQRISPPINLGWNQRLKSDHFEFYKSVSEDFASALKIDPWLVAPAFRQASGVDFMQRVGVDELTEKATSLFEEISDKYQKHGVTEKPFIIVKADAGTYGMGVMTIRDPKDLESLNRKQRTHMSTAKGNRAVDRVILQEGVHTFERWEDNGIAEPVVYMIGPHVVGGFYRVHEKRGVDENLNSPGMKFEPLSFADCCRVPGECGDGEKPQNRFYVYGVVARLSLLAAAREKFQAENAGAPA